MQNELLIKEETKTALETSDLTAVIEKAELAGGLDHREAVALTASEEAICSLAREIREHFFSRVTTLTGAAGTPEESDRLKKEGFTRVLSIPDEAVLTAKLTGNFLEDVCALVMEAEAKRPRRVVITRESIPDDVFVRLLAAVRCALPTTGITIDAAEAFCEMTEPDENNKDVTITAGTIADDLLVPAGELGKTVLALAKRGVVAGLTDGCDITGRDGRGRDELIGGGELGELNRLNSLVALKEYAADRADEDTRIAATDLVLAELYKIEDKTERDAVVRLLKDIREGKRGQRI